jgi:hypothetical protein
MRTISRAKRSAETACSAGWCVVLGCRPHPRTTPARNHACTTGVRLEPHRHGTTPARRACGWSHTPHGITPGTTGVRRNHTLHRITLGTTRNQHNAPAYHACITRFPHDGRSYHTCITSACTMKIGATRAADCDERCMKKGVPTTLPSCRTCTCTNRVRLTPSYSICDESSACMLYW